MVITLNIGALLQGHIAVHVDTKFSWVRWCVPAIAGTPPEGQVAKAPLFMLIAWAALKRTRANTKRCFAM